MARHHTLFVFLIAAFLVAGCSTNTSDVPERGNDPWVFRSVLDGHPRMLTLALGEDFWVAYSAQTGALYQVWKHGVAFEGAVYNQAHGPQPTSEGLAWVVNDLENPWQLIREGDGALVTPQLQFRGHVLRDDEAVLMYELIHDDGTVVRIEETPRYVRDGANPGLQRTFTVEDYPDDWLVSTDLHLQSLRAERAYETDGALEEMQAGDGMLEARLTLNRNAPTMVVSYFTEEPGINKLYGGGDDEDLPHGLALIEEHNCVVCHNLEVQTVGPSFNAIAAQYAYTSFNVDMLVGKIRNGGSGVWGEAVMIPHPQISDEDLNEMTNFIMGLDGEAPRGDDALSGVGDSAALMEDASNNGQQGLAVNVWRSSEPITGMREFPGPPVHSGVVPSIHFVSQDDFGELTQNFFVEAKGSIEITEPGNYVFRLVSDDGGILYFNGSELINHDGLHGPTPRDAELQLQAGTYPTRLQYFQSGGGKALSLQWIRHGEDSFSVIPQEHLRYSAEDLQETAPFVEREKVIQGIPGDTIPLTDVHPSFDLDRIRPDGFEPMVGGLDVTEDGTVYVSTWTPEGGVYRLTNITPGDPNATEVVQIASGLAEPLGLKVVDGEVYVLQKHELTHLLDDDGDGVMDTYRTVSNGWGATANFHEFAFGLEYEDGYFYATLATAILPGGASASPQNPDRGKLIRIDRETGEVMIMAHGLRTPNGIGYGVDGELFIADNQGDWLPSSKIVHVKEGAFYGSRSVDPEGTANLEEMPPVVWLPQDEIGNSPSQPAPLNVGPYAGQMMHGEVTHGGLKRVFVEEVDGQLQGAVFRFTQGLEAGVNRTVVGPDGHIYIGGIGNPGNWSHYGTYWYGLQRLRYNGQSAFEMLAVRVKQDGLEITFTEPLAGDDGFNPEAYHIEQWRYEPTIEYGGPKLDQETLPVRSVQMDEGRDKVFLEIPGLKEGHVVYVRLMEPWISAEGHGLWTTEAWYTLNRLPAERGFRSTLQPERSGPNTLTEAEEATGWKLLFDGQSTDGWRTFGSTTIGSSWRVEDGALTLGGEKDGWQFADGGDIITAEAYEDFDLRLEWKVAPCGNSGIIYNVVEAPGYDYVWQTGPEMQILDNTCHDDGQIHTHRAGDLYDLIAAPFRAERSAGEWNHVRILQQDGRVEQWLNGAKIVEVIIGSPEWDELVQASKFADMDGFGKATAGHIALQDHGDRIWFRNIKIRQL